MREGIQTRLESQGTSYSVEQQLHDVPPHEVYEVVVDGQRAVYKGDTGPTGNAGVEGRIIEFVGEQTAVPVPEILRVETDYYLTAWDSAAPSPDGDQQADRAWASVAGRGLARLHEETAPVMETYGAFQRDSGGVTTTRHEEWHTAAVEYVRHRRPVLDQYGYADVADLVVELLTDHPDAFAGAGGPVCCHGWATPEHVSVADGRVACMVDFEHAIAAPGEYDYWRTVFPAFGPAESAPALQAFREGYEAVRPLQRGLDRRKPFYALLNGVYYFESLYVQDQHGPEKTETKAAQLQRKIREIVGDLT